MVNLVFDYDGTLHHSIKIYAPAFRKAYRYLVSQGEAPDRAWSDEEISQWLGYSSKEMWCIFMPHLPQHLKDDCSNRIATYMLGYVKEGKAQLYPRSIEVLQHLKERGYNLIFLSNCKEAYMQSHIEQFRLGQYFSGFYCTERFDFKPKYEIFNTIKKDYGGTFIIIGDRFQDMEVAKKHGLMAIGCEYGYGKSGELEGATARIQDISQLPTILGHIEH